MPNLLPWLPLLAPLPLGIAGLVPRRAEPAAWLALTAASGVAVAVALAGTLHTQTLGAAGIGIALHADAVTAVMAVLVGFIGLVIVRFSQTYLQGEPGQLRFMRLLCLTLASVLLLIVAGNLALFALAWAAMSVTLHRLLLFYPGRPAAVLAARKKFLISRAGDACLLAAMALLYRDCGSLDIVAVLQTPPGAAGVLLAAAAVLKSAQFPLHGWLLEVMETPTPVSALLHAGVINAGGFLVLRFAPLIAASPAGSDLLILFGAATAVFGAACMVTQSAVKTALAYSTLAQIGFMLLECGLGAYSAALLHITAHSLYKAHAFLTSGSVLAQPAARPAADGAVAARIAGGAVAVLAAYAGLQWLAASLTEGVLPAAPHAGWIGAMVVLLAAGAARATFLPNLLPSGPVWQALRIHLAHGLYVNTLANRLVLRFWPAPPPLRHTPAFALEAAP